LDSVISKIKRFLKEVEIELKRVTWPSRKELYGSTVVVLLMVFALAVFIGFVDIILSRIVALILR